MNQTTIKYSDKIAMENFMSYIAIPNCKYNIETIIITCNYDEIYVRIAEKIFHAQVTSE